jgi:hypothetical protein
VRRQARIGERAIGRGGVLVDGGSYLVLCVGHGIHGGERRGEIYRDVLVRIEHANLGALLGGGERGGELSEDEAGRLSREEREERLGGGNSGNAHNVAFVRVLVEERRVQEGTARRACRGRR